MADCEAATVAPATVIAGIRGGKANRHPREELVCPGVSAGENHAIAGRKRE